MCRNNTCFLFAQYLPTALLSPHPQPRTLSAEEKRVVETQRASCGDSPTQTPYPRVTGVRASWSSGGPGTQDRHRDPDQGDKCLPGCPASSLCGHCVQLVMRWEGREQNWGFSFPQRLWLPNSCNTHRGRQPELKTGELHGG